MTKSTNLFLVFLCIIGVVVAVSIGYLIHYTQGNRAVGHTNQMLVKTELHLVCSLPTLTKSVDCVNLRKLIGAP